MKAISDKRFWELVDYYEANEGVIDTLSCDLIGVEYQKMGSEDYEQACLDLDLLLKGKSEPRQYEYLKRTYF